MSEFESENKTFCAYPWFHLQVKPNGVIKPCCRFDVNHLAEYSAGDESLKLKESQSWKNLREKMNSGSAPKGCHKCLDEESLGIKSMRLSFKEANRKFEYQGLQVGLENLEVGFGNKCNLACRSCGSNLSTKWREDDIHLEKHFSINRDLPSEFSIKNRIDWNVKEIYHNLKYVKFTGGEPFLEADFETFLTQLISTGKAEQTFLRICTNASFIPKKELLNLLSQFYRVDLSVSIDGQGTHNDYLRYPSRWHKVEETLYFWKNFIKSKPKWTITLCSTVSLLSLESLPPLLRWWSDYSKDSEQIAQVIFQPVYQPYYLSPAIVPKEVLDQFYEDEGQMGYLKYFSTRKFTDEKVDAFFEFTEILDRKRKQSFVEAFPKLNKAFLGVHKRRAY